MEQCVTETKIMCQATLSQITIQIDPRTGQFDGMSSKRGYDLLIHNSTKPNRIRVGDQPWTSLSSYPDNSISPPKSWHFDEISQQIRLSVQEDTLKQNSIIIEIMNDANTEKELWPGENLNHAEDREPDTRNPVWENELEISIVSGDITRAMEALERLWMDQKNTMLSNHEGYEQLLYLSGLLVGISQRQGWKIYEILGEEYEHFLNLTSQIMHIQAYTLLQRVILRAVDYLQARRKSPVHVSIKQVIAIVEREMEQDLSLKMVAKRLHLNSSHLSRLFKREMGSSFSVYVLERKMEKAKQMLLEEILISDVSDRLGYKDISYFIHVFRKFWGFTPGEYRNSVHLTHRK
ncbi:HTH-type transcriptional regulator YesS [compost metagenome]